MDPQAEVDQAAADPGQEGAVECPLALAPVLNADRVSLSLSAHVVVALVSCIEFVL
jgi:hypothetical protein